MYSIDTVLNVKKLIKCILCVDIGLRTEIRKRKNGKMKLTIKPRRQVILRFINKLIADSLSD